MAIVLDFIDLVVPIETIRQKYPGGWEGCLRDNADFIGGAVWYDEHLFREGAMSPQDINYLCARWEEIGFEIKDSKDGKPVWKDICVVESMGGGPTLPCEWLIFDWEKNIAYLKGTEPGKIIGPASFQL